MGFMTVRAACRERTVLAYWWFKNHDWHLEKKFLRVHIRHVHSVITRSSSAYSYLSLTGIVKLLRPTRSECLFLVCRPTLNSSSGEFLFRLCTCKNTVTNFAGVCISVVQVASKVLLLLSKTL